MAAALIAAGAGEAMAQPDYRQSAMDKARAKYAARGITDEDLADIKRKLAARGLATDHLPATLEAGHALRPRSDAGGTR